MRLMKMKKKKNIEKRLRSDIIIVDLQEANNYFKES